MSSQQTSGVLASKIITRARYYLNEATEGFHLDAELLSYLNDGVLDIVTQTHCLEAVETEELIENILSYALANPFILIRTVVYNQGSGNQKGLIKGNLQSIGRKIQAKEPMHWISSENNVIVYPKPDAAHSGTGHDIDVYTVKRPGRIANYSLTDLTFVDGGAGADTITTAAGDFLEANFEAEDIFNVSGSASNDGDYTIVSVVAGTITLATGTLTAEGAADVSATLSELIITPACYDPALVYYMTAQGKYKDQLFNQGDSYMTKYQNRIDRYRADFVKTPKEPDEIVK